MEANEQIHYTLHVLEKPLAIAKMDSYKENLQRASTLNMMLKAKAREDDDVIESRFVELAKLQEHLSGFQIAAKRDWKALKKKILRNLSRKTRPTMTMTTTRQKIECWHCATNRRKKSHSRRKSSLASSNHLQQT